MSRLTPSRVRPPNSAPSRGTLQQAIRYCRRFGFRAGMQVARAHAGSTLPVSIQLPGFRFPLWARPGTSDAATFDEVFVAREYDVTLPDLSPRWILDLGANVGYASVFFAQRWPQATILAVEPDLENLSLLKRNTGHYSEIRALHAAVWSHPAQVSVANPDDDANSFRMTESATASASRVPAFTIGQLIDRLGCERLSLLKMDVEGAEKDILRTASDWIGRVDVLVVELHDRFVPGCGEALNEAMQGRHFRQEILGQNLVFDLRERRAAGR